ncbi:MAG: FAD-binding oxidoreductase [Hyphomicrobiaceae bacterium]
MPENRCLWWDTAGEDPVIGVGFPDGRNFDVAIVGAGLTGLSAALTLAEAGRKVVVLEAHEPGHGGSGRSGGQVQAGFGTSIESLTHGASDRQRAGIVQLANGCADELFSLIDRYKIRCAPMRAGLIRGIHHPRLLESTRGKVERDPALRFLSREEAARLVGAPLYCGAILDPRSGHVNPMALTRGLARAAIAAGMCLVTGQRVSNLSVRANQWRLTTASGEVSAGHVILATNAYADELHPALRRTLVVVNSFQIATEPFSGGPLSGGHIASDTRRLVFYYRRDTAGRFIVGGRGTIRGANRLENYRFLRDWLSRSFPEAADVPLSHFWAGRVAITTDHIPHIHEPAPNLHVVSGYNGKGMALAPAMGTRIARRILEDDVDELCLPVRPIAQVPLWSLRNLGVTAHVALYRALDRMGR